MIQLRVGRLLLLMGVLCLAGIGILSWVDAGPVSDEEQYHLRAIEKDQKSEEGWYDYALFLWREERFDEATEKLNKLLELNPNHQRGRALQENIVSVRGLQDRDARKKAMLDFMMKDLSDSMQQLKTNLESVQPGLEPHPVSASSGQNAVTVDVGGEPMIATYTPSMAEFHLQMLIEKYRDLGDDKEMETLYKKWVQEYPASPGAKIDFMSYLIQRDRLDEAKPLYVESLKQFSKDARIEAVGVCLDELRVAKSTEQRQGAKEKLQRTLITLALKKLQHKTASSN